jgi:tyrosinase
MVLESASELLTRRRFLAVAGSALACAALPLTAGPSLAESSAKTDSQGLVIRRNVTSISGAEKADIVNAILKMKQVRSPFDPTVSYYDQFARWHLLSLSCPREEHAGTPWPAHASPGFLPWHRLLVLLFERGMQEVSGKRIPLPYWNWTEHESAEAVFTEDFMGPRRGDPKQNYVMSAGPFRKDAFTINVRSAPSEDPGQSRHLVRAYSVAANDFFKAIAPNLPDARELEEAMALNTYDVAPFDISADHNQSFRGQLEGWQGFKSIACSVDGVEAPVPGDAPKLLLHNRVHYFVGGSFMVGDQVWFGSVKTHCSPNDPVFFLHHAFVDKIWADWMARHGRQYLPASSIPRRQGAVAATPGKNTPLPPFDRVASHIATPARVLNHHSLGYAYDTDTIGG